MDLHKLSGGWLELKAKLQSAWARLTDEDLRRVENNWDELSNKLQKTYGYTREEAQEEVENFREQYLSAKEVKSEHSRSPSI
jgi:uncharacterized protein YjbJ (UPF0337 family)